MAFDQAHAFDQMSREVAELARTYDAATVRAQFIPTITVYQAMGDNAFAEKVREAVEAGIAMARDV